MFMKKKRIVRQWIAQRMLFKKLFVFNLVFLGFSNKHLQELEVRNKVFRYLKRKYEKHLNKLTYREDVDTPPKHIWICWLQGFENAPEIVKTCYESVKLNNPDCEITIIDENNYKDYTNLPDYVVAKYQKGRISAAHFSDLIRTNLLYEQGGVWIDATVYMTGKIPQHVFEKPLFLYQSICRGDQPTRTFNNWFIAAQKHSFFLEAQQTLLYAYWKKQKVARDYFIWHLLATIVGQKYPQIVANVNRVPDATPEILRTIYPRKFDPVYWGRLKDMTPIHKLTHKQDEKPEQVEGTYYDYIVNKRGQ